MEGDSWRRDRACLRCHSHKLKCTRLPNKPRCERCARLEVNCKPRPTKDDRCDRPELEQDPNTTASRHGINNDLASFDALIGRESNRCFALDKSLDRPGMPERTESLPSMPFTPTLTNTPATFSSNDLQLPSLTDVGDWNGPQLLQNDFDENIFNTSIAPTTDTLVAFDRRPNHQAPPKGLQRGANDIEPS